MAPSQLRIAVGLAALVAGLSCSPKPAPPPDRPRAGDVRPEARRVDAPPPPAPRGPDLTDQLLVTARLGALSEVDRRIAALLPSVIPAPFVQGLVTRRMIPEMARDIGLNALVLEAIDYTRPALFGLLVPASTRRSFVPRPQVVALLPLRSDPSLVNDGLRVSFPESTLEPWGGLRIRQGDQTVAWVHARGGWVAVAPTAPLCDSARRALEPLAKGTEEGTLSVDVRYAQLLAIYRPIIAMGWSRIRSLAGRTDSSRLRRPEDLLVPFLPHLEKLAPYLASFDRVELFGRIADDGWSLRLKATPSAGGKAAEWVSGLKSPGRFGVDLLPPEAALVSQDRHGEASRLFASQVYEQVTQWAAELVIARDLPAQAKERGLLDRKTAAPFEVYRRTLRDLNLEDYRASYALYKLVYEVQAMRRLLVSGVTRLGQATTGETVFALYAPEGHLGVGQVDRVKNLAAHRGAMMALAVGMQRQATSLLSGVWALIPAEARDRMGMRACPLRVVYNPVALQVGRTTVSSLALRIRWPGAPAAGRGAPASPEQREAREIVEMARKIVEHLFGKGDLTVAWAYAGDRVVYSIGHDWAPRMRAMLGRAAPGAKLPTALADPMFQNTLQDLKGESLSLTVVSGARLLLAGLALLKVVSPSLAAAPGPIGMVLGQITQNASSAQRASLARESREEGAYVIEGRLPNDDLKGPLMGAGMLLFSTMSRSGGSSASPPMPVPPISPPHP